MNHAAVLASCTDAMVQNKEEAELPTKPGEVKEFSSGSSSSVLHDHIIIIISAVAIIVYEMMDDD